MSFQQAVNINPPLGVEGSFASIGVTHSAIAGAMQFVADTAGVSICRFAWCNTVTGKTTTAKPADATNCVLGFVGRDSNIAVITDWQGSYSNLIPSGMALTAFDRGDFFVKTTVEATLGQKIFASDTTGEIAVGAAGATVAGFTETPFTVAKSGAANTIIKMTAQ